MYNPFSLNDKTILITGASSGIGRVVSIECSKLGAKVVITGRNRELLNNTYNQLDGDGHFKITADLTDSADMDKLVKDCPKLNGFVSNAGISKVLLVKSINNASLDEILNINTIAPILLTQKLIKSGKIKNQSSIVYNSSISGLYCVNIGESVYAASKGAINSFAKGAALDLSKQQIRVNCVNPGIISTDLYEHNEFLTQLDKDEKMKSFPLKRFGKPSDVAFAIIYLLSDAASWVTGTNLIIDGGYTLI